MGEKELRKVIQKMHDLGAKPDDVMKLTKGLETIRTKWGDLFTELGKSLSKAEITEFKSLFSTKFKNYLGSTYEFMYNKSLIPWFRYNPLVNSLIELNKFLRIVMRQLEENSLGDLEAESHGLQCH